MVARQTVGVRLSEGGLAVIDAVAADTEAKRSAVIRVVLAEALKDAKLMKVVADKLDAAKDVV